MKESIYHYKCDRCGIGDTAHIPTAGPDWPLGWAKIYAEVANLDGNTHEEIDLCLKCQNELGLWLRTFWHEQVEEF